MLSKLFGAVLAALSISLSTAGSAATVFNLAGNGGLTQSYTFGPIDGIGLTVNAGTFVIGANPSLDVVIEGDGGGYPQVGQYSQGLGVTSYRGDAHYVDGRRRDEILLLRFTENVRFVSATFGYVDSNDDFEFWFDDEHDDSLDGNYLATFDIPNSSSTYVLLTEHIGQLFGIGASQNNDDFKVKAVKVESVAQVPLPAALPLMAAALGALGLFGRRRRRADRG